jgi:predicted nucleic acid-binding protein
MGRPAVIYDACVLYPAPLRDLLLQLACEGLFRAKWTHEIQDEWTRNLLRDRPDLDPRALARTRQLMDRAIPGALVRGHEALIEGLALPDPDDRHVLAAAIRGHAQVIVTFNVRDFPANVLKKHGVKAMHPDKFVGGWINRAPEAVCRAVQQCLRRLKHPPLTPDDYISCLARQGLDATASFLKMNSGLIV